MRLDKYLSDMGEGTRSILKKEIKAGHVTVDGVTIKDPGASVSADSDVKINGKSVRYEEYVYYMLHKPEGVISASEDPKYTTVVDLITDQKRKDLFPVGRLDRDTEGLLIITNDGDLAHRLLAPRHHVDKIYYACVSGTVTDKDVQEFRCGLILPDGLECLPAELNIIDLETAPVDIFYELIRSPHNKKNNNIPYAIDEISSVTEVLITIREGKFHQIKRMFQAIGHEVLYLKRLSMGPLSLDPDLAPGEYRRLTADEITQLKSI